MARTVNNEERKVSKVLDRLDAELRIGWEGILRLVSTCEWSDLLEASEFVAFRDRLEDMMSEDEWDYVMLEGLDGRLMRLEKAVERRASLLADLERVKSEIRALCPLAHESSVKRGDELMNKAFDCDECEDEEEGDEYDECDDEKHYEYISYHYDYQY